MVGYSREELIGQSSASIHPDAAEWERLGEQQHEALSRHGSFTHERRLVRRNGEVFWVQMAGSCVRANDPDSGVIWTFLDITERKKAEDDTLAALQRQRELNDLRSRFVSMTSHEFRTPLASILSSTELLKDYGERLPADEKAQIFQSIEHSVQRMTGMLERVLHIGRAEARMLEFNPRTLDLAALCRSLVDEVLVEHPEAGVRLVVEYPEAELFGSFDDKLLRHVVVNLLGNAIKYSPQGGAIRLRLGRAANRVVIEVSDHGIGIPAAEIGHLFESFHRASNVGSIQGTGLGLAIVKNSVDLHGGRIQVRSEPGQGTTFTVQL
jgi:PAS domain S-box-containing protein